MSESDSNSPPENPRPSKPPSPAVAKKAPGVRDAREAPTSDVSLKTGDVVGGVFQVDRLLGSSGGGVSYLCTNKKTQEQVVIKVLAVANPGEELANEARSTVKKASSIRQRNLTKILGMGETANGQIFVAMEYVRGSTVSRVLAQRREKGEGITMRDAFTILAHTCDALEAAHEKLAHGVLTPYNIYLSHKGIVKVGNLAFGRIAAKHLLDHEESGPFIDSIYVAPEATNDPDHITPASDLFSLGMIAAELLGDKGLPGERRRAQRAALDGLNDCPPSLVNLIASCIDSNAENRPEDVKVFRDTFESAAREYGEKLGGKAPEGHLPIEPAVDDEDESATSDDDDIFDIPELSDEFGEAEDEGEQRYLVQKDGLDYGPFSYQQVLDQLHEDEIDEFTLVLDRVTQDRLPLGEMGAFEQEVEEYIPIREERRRQEAERRAELERKVKKGAGVGLIVAVVAGAIALVGMTVYYFSLPDPEELPVEKAFVSMDFKFLPPPKDFQTVSADKELLSSIFNPAASQEEIERKVKKSVRRSKKRAKSGGGGSGESQEAAATVDMASGSGSGKILTDHEINQKIMSDFGSLRSCIMRELKSNRSFKGVTVQFFIRPSGTTGGVKIRESKYANKPVGRCIVQQFRSMKFPEHGAISNKGVTFPLRVQ
ncbi:MAG: protein kinase domain-containing protein [Myxococcota bacterium]